MMGCRALREGGHGLRWGGGKRKGRTWWGGKAREEGRGQSGSRESVSRILHPQAEARARWDMGLRGTGQRERESGERREERGEARLHTRRLRSGAQNQQQKRTQGHQWHTGPERTLGKHKRILLVPGASLDGRLAALGSNRPCRAAWSAVPAHGARREAVR
jgi:hypothetical protein